MMFICDISVFNKYGKQKLDEMLRPLRMDWRELVVMLVIEQVPGISQTRLVPFLQTDKANVTKSLQAMEGKGLIRRESDQDDMRNKVCYLTTEGEALAPKLQEILDLWEAACFKGINKDDLLHYKRINDMITNNLVGEWKTD
ncbi:MAG TPA: MarR family transcriptional regulator [Clostridiaceae bacterium]|nr:MarR family transcriptional regulator [Clostridiaceae bacterium]